MTVTVVQDETLRSIVELLDDVGSPLARRCADLLKTGQHASYLALGLSDASFDTFREDYLALEVASKYPYLDVNIDREKVALEKFFEIEGKLALSDGWLYRFSKGWNKHPLLHAVLHTARRKIEKLLGDFHWECAEAYFSFGPGATVSLPRRKASTPNKFSNLKLTVTQSCLDLAVWAVCRNECWADYLASRYGRDPSGWFRLTPGNKVVTVPKNAKTDRTIAIEPDLNMFLQKGIGGMLRRKLKTVSVDLDDQTLNQRMARDGSLSGTLGTIDLSSASDSVSTRLVEELVPPSWLDAIKASRSANGVLPDGSLISYRKVSSMGNGYTFELESLIFWSLAVSTLEVLGSADRRFAVYGDDIILPIDCVEPFLDVLSCCGFSPNSKKTHTSGPFRESCGKHYLAGDDVTPFYVKDRVDSVDRKFWWLNTLSVWAGKPYQFWLRDNRLKKSWDRCFNTIPDSCRRLGPLFAFSESEQELKMRDSCIGVPFDAAKPHLKRKDGLEGFYFPTRIPVDHGVVYNSIGTLIGFLDRFGRFQLRPRCELSRGKGRVKWENSYSLTPQ